jgi:hypothetical protein
MTKSLGDFNIERSSSSDTKNITWSQKTPLPADKPKKKNSNKAPKNTSATNIIYTETDEEMSVEKIFVIEPVLHVNKNKNPDRRFENTSASNSNIQQGFERPSR